MTAEFWEQPEIVGRFAARDPDHRLLGLVSRMATPARVRILDLGCAGGRNTEFLVRRGVSVRAADASAGMVRATRNRMTPWWSETVAADRVRQCAMTAIDEQGWRPFDAVLALGVLHCAASREEWDAALDALRRMIVPSGWVLVANHTPAFDPEGTGLTPVSGQPHLFDGSASGRSFLVSGPVLDREFARHGFRPLAPTETIRVATESGRRETVNALYRRL